MTKRIFLLLSVVAAVLPAAAKIIIPDGVTLEPAHRQQLEQRFRNHPGLDLEENWRVHQILDEALARSAQASYSAVSRDCDFFTPGAEVRFKRFVDSDGFVFKRAEVYVGGELSQVYIGNREGQFGEAGGMAMRISEVLLLSWPEILHEEFPSMGISSYDLQDIRYLGRACCRIRVETHFLDIREQHLLTRSTSEEVRDPDSRLSQRYPMVREFIIDRDSRWILARAHFNRLGKKIASWHLDAVEPLAGFDPASFATPQERQGDVVLRSDFLYRAMPEKTLIPDRPSGLNPVVRWSVRFGRWLIAPATLNGFAAGFLVLGLGLIGFVAVYKHRERKNSRRRAARRR